MFNSREKADADLGKALISAQDFISLYKDWTEPLTIFSPLNFINYITAEITEFVSEYVSNSNFWLRLKASTNLSATPKKSAII